MSRCSTTTCRWPLVRRGRRRRGRADPDGIPVAAARAVRRPRSCARGARDGRPRLGHWPYPHRPRERRGGHRQDDTRGRAGRPDGHVQCSGVLGALPRRRRRAADVALGADPAVTRRPKRIAARSAHTGAGAAAARDRRSRRDRPRAGGSAVPAVRRHTRSTAAAGPRSTRSFSCWTTSTGPTPRRCVSSIPCHGAAQQPGADRRDVRDPRARPTRP